MVTYDVRLESTPSAFGADTCCPVLVHLERMGSFSENSVRMYVAELGSALAFLHEKKIIHRYERGKA